MNNQQVRGSKTEKVVRLVEYLQKLATLRTKLIRDIGEYERVLWLSDCPHDQGCYTRAWGLEEEHEPDEWLEVQGRREPELPAVPNQCQDWVNLSSLRNKNELPALLPEIIQQVPNPGWREQSGQPRTISKVDQLQEHPEVQHTWRRYVENTWLPWTEVHNAWTKNHEVYSSLFAIHQEQLRLGEEYELVLGVGLLTWQPPAGQRIRRHLVVADASLEFEARIAKFIVRPHSDGAKLRPELDMLDIEEQPARAEDAARATLRAAADDPWETSCIEGMLQALVHSLDSQGRYDDSLEVSVARASARPIVEYAPALILRKRSAKGLTETLQRIKEKVVNGESIPDEFADLAEIRTRDADDHGSGPNVAAAAFDGEIFFPKPSNDEQRRIVETIRAASGVLVQGPPGTGKSHTIANLICHLLATGQRTLITAKTPRALQVLERLVPEELRPLCVNLLGSGLEERRSLETSVGGILQKNGEWSELQAHGMRQQLEKKLQKLREENAIVSRRLRDNREAETHTHSIAEGAYRGTAARIADAVNRDRAHYGWFTDEITFERTCPVSASDLTDVLLAMRRFTPERRAELNLAWPEELCSQVFFASLVHDEANAIKEEKGAVSGADENHADLLARNSPVSLDAVCRAFSSLLDASRILRVAPHSWMNEALRDILGGNSSLWHEVQRVTRNVVASINDLVASADETRIEFPDTIDIRALHDDARTLTRHLENGGRLGWGLFRPKPVRERLYVIKEVTIMGRRCSTAEHFAKLTDALRVRIEVEKAWGVWKAHYQMIEAPYAFQLTALRSLGDALDNALALEVLIVACRDAIGQCSSLGEPVWADESEIERKAASCRLALARIRMRFVIGALHDIEAPLLCLIRKGNTHQVTTDLQQAVQSRDLNGFAQCVNRIQELEAARQRLQDVDEYLLELRGLLPRLAKSLENTCNEPYWEERILSISESWRWGRARYWIEDYIRQEDVPALVLRTKQIENEINSTIAKLASLHAWSFCFSRLKEDHRRHMEAWQQSMRRLGKGTGKHAPRHRREAQEHLNECREAVPAWVMPLHRVWDTVFPSPGMFDVIIVDEASQCGVEALPLLYLGKKILIVGDDKQISPDAVGLPRDAVHALMDEYLHDFHFRSSFDIESSLFDHGKLRYGTRRITLREHFRCMPEIIRFSNNLCYADTPLIPLRQYGPKRLPPLERVFVSGGYREGSNSRAINRPEAEAIVARIMEMCGSSQYDEKTMGVVVLQGEAQAALIENQLLERLGAEEMERRRLICGNPYSFQGDERDIMFLSLVAAPNERIGPLVKAADERRFNVAASRARDMMILYHSVTCDDLSVSCLRRKLLEFFELTGPQQIAGIERDDLERRAAQDNRRVVDPPSPFESWFEVDVALVLLRKGFVVMPQHEVAGKRIDIVVEGGQARLAVECDGDKWHGADRYEADMQRQRQLERCGWEFFRVREAAFYANQNSALVGLWHALEERGIHVLSSQGNRLPECEEAAPQPSTP